MARPGRSAKRWEYAQIVEGGESFEALQRFAERTLAGRRLSARASHRLFVEAGIVTLTAFISPMRADRDRVRQIVGPERFIEIFVACPLEVCERRDVKGMYRRARTDEIPEFTGISAPYEPPEAPALTIDTDKTSLTQSVARVLEILGPML